MRFSESFFRHQNLSLTSLQFLPSVFFINFTLPKFVCTLTSHNLFLLSLSSPKTVLNPSFSFNITLHPFNSFPPFFPFLPSKRFSTLFIAPTLFYKPFSSLTFRYILLPITRNSLVLQVSRMDMAFLNCSGWSEYLRVTNPLASS